MGKYWPHFAESRDLNHSRPPKLDFENLKEKKVTFDVTICRGKGVCLSKKSRRNWKGVPLTITSANADGRLGGRGVGFIFLRDYRREKKNAQSHHGQLELDQGTTSFHHSQGDFLDHLFFWGIETQSDFFFAPAGFSFFKKIFALIGTHRPPQHHSSFLAST